ncbi:hypothetical protein B0H14DRAFT_2718847 [Mycena olivaceomarginata]|nr:hypothetical protein B0H14DRAFT_2718847 [Mycena olivaceomarginata]
MLTVLLGGFPPISVLCQVSGAFCQSYQLPSSALSARTAVVRPPTFLWLYKGLHTAHTHHPVSACIRLCSGAHPFV